MCLLHVSLFSGGTSLNLDYSPTEDMAIEGVKTIVASVVKNLFLSLMYI